jgi:hypothetical protein
MGESQVFKPAIITHYNATKGGVDVVDKLAWGIRHTEEHVGGPSDYSAMCLMLVA